MQQYRMCGNFCSMKFSWLQTKTRFSRFYFHGSELKQNFSQFYFHRSTSSFRGFSCILQLFELVLKLTLHNDYARYNSLL